MDDIFSLSLNDLHSRSDTADTNSLGAEVLEVVTYPDLKDVSLETTTDEQADDLVDAALIRSTTPSVPLTGRPEGYVSNARNVPSHSDTFTFWAPADAESLGIGTLVRHTTPNISGTTNDTTYAIITKAEAQTLGLDDFAIHAYEEDSVPPNTSIMPSRSQRRAIVSYEAKVLSTTLAVQRPVSSGPVYSVKAYELAALHNQPGIQVWPDAAHMLLGFYDDGIGNYGVFAEEQTRVIGPKQGHVILSGQPGAGKTSLFLTLVITLYAKLRAMAVAPKVAAVAFNVKGGDLLFLDHLDTTQMSIADSAMWQAAGVNPTKRPFDRVITYVPLADDGLNIHSLRSAPKANQLGYSETRKFALGIQDLWPYLGLFFDNRSTPTTNLLAEIEQELEEIHLNGFSLAQVLELLETISKPQKDRKETRWGEYNLATIRAIKQRFQALPATLGGLIDVTGTGFGLDGLKNLQPYDMVVIDLERIMNETRDPEMAQTALKIITAYVLNLLTEEVTLGMMGVDHIIVFADELNRLAPRHANNGIGERLAQLARTTRDRGIVLFGAGQFRSGINEDILKAAAIHFSMQTPEYELTDSLYSTFSPEFKARLTRLAPGETLLQYPSLRSAVFARFPRPFLLTGVAWLDQFPPAARRPFAECVAERLHHCDLTQPLQQSEVEHLINGLPPTHTEKEARKREGEIVADLRRIEIAIALKKEGKASAWLEFSATIKQRYGNQQENSYPPVPAPAGYHANVDEEDEE